MSEQVPPLKRSLFVDWLPRLMYVVAALSLAFTLIPSETLAGRVVGFIAMWLVPMPIFDLLSVTVAIMLAAALQRRKRVAWRILTVALVLQSLILIAQLVTVALGQEEIPAEVRGAGRVCVASGRPARGSEGQTQHHVGCSGRGYRCCRNDAWNNSRR